jgi:hypothetical protein
VFRGFSANVGVWLAGLALLAGSGVAAIASAAEEKEPPTLNPFGPIKQERDDAVPGYVELSDGSIYPGNIYMTRDKRLKIEDKQLERQREIPLRVVARIECKVDKEWIEREWRFKELALDEKMYTGKKYPARVYSHTITLRDGRAISGPLAEILYVRPFADASGGPLDASQLEAKRFMLHKRDKGENGTDLKSLLYVKVVKLGKDAFEEGKEKAAKAATKGKAGGKTAKKTTVKRTREEEPKEEDAEEPATKPVKKKAARSEE